MTGSLALQVSRQDGDAVYKACSRHTPWGNFSLSSSHLLTLGLTVLKGFPWTPRGLSPLSMGQVSLCYGTAMVRVDVSLPRKWLFWFSLPLSSSLVNQRLACHTWECLVLWRHNLALSWKLLHKVWALVAGGGWRAGNSTGGHRAAPSLGTDEVPFTGWWVIWPGLRVSKYSHGRLSILCPKGRTVRKTNHLYSPPQSRSLHGPENRMFMAGQIRGSRQWPWHPAQGGEVLCKYTCLIPERVKTPTHLGVISLFPGKKYSQTEVSEHILHSHSCSFHS